MKTPLDLRGKRVLVMGLGVHGGGLGVTRFLVQQGAQVTATDLRSAEELAPTLAQLEGLPVRYVLGEHRMEDFRAADMVVRNPGVPRESPLLAAAREAGAAVEMEMTLFFRLCPGPILGITGTKGKTTTTLLAGAMLREQFPDTVVAGNLRVSALEQLPKIDQATPVVLELSSWQLEGLGEAGVSPSLACITNLSEDHLDRYASMDAYGEAKVQIFKHQDDQGIAVLNMDDPYARPMAEQAPGEVVWFGGAEDAATERRVFYVPRLERQRGQPRFAWWSGGRLFWHENGRREQLCELGDVRLPGAHNLANVAAAAALARAAGVAVEYINGGIRGFGGVPHRMETVRELDGVRWINDTTATAPAAAIAALKSVDGPAIVIAGGADKRLDFAEMAENLAERAKAVVLLAGTATPKLEQALRRSGRALQLDGPYDAFADAVAAARGLAQAGDTVLLSPGCASFGMFRNEFDRGEQFRQLVQALP